MSSTSRRQSGVNRPPAYSRAKEKGRADRAYIWLDGKRIYLGLYGSAESRAKYNELIAKPTEVTSVPTPSTDPTVSELMADYLGHVDEYYGHKSSESLCSAQQVTVFRYDENVVQLRSTAVLQIFSANTR
jgi:hypothetical protein